MPIIVRCERGAGDKEAPSISDNLLITENMAVLRGTRFLDDPSQGAYYLTKKRTIRVPHKLSGAGADSAVVPGKWIKVTDGFLGLNNQKLKVKSYIITLTPKSVYATIETEQYEEFII